MEGQTHRSHQRLLFAANIPWIASDVQRLRMTLTETLNAEKIGLPEYFAIPFRSKHCSASVYELPRAQALKFRQWDRPDDPECCILLSHSVCQVFVQLGSACKVSEAA